MDPRAQPATQTLGDAIARTARAGHDGDVILRDRSGRTHRVTLRLGCVVAVRLAGRFDPLLERLYRRALIDEAGLLAALEALSRSERRVGELAIEVANVRPEDVRAALEAQLRERLHELFLVARTEPSTLGLVWRVVPAREGCGALPWRESVLGTPRARCARAAEPRAQRSAPQRCAAPPMPTTRAELRRLAKHCHPDLTRHLPAAERAARAVQFARATAAFHGLR